MSPKLAPNPFTMPLHHFPTAMFQTLPNSNVLISLPNPSNDIQDFISKSKPVLCKLAHHFNKSIQFSPLRPNPLPAPHKYHLISDPTPWANAKMVKSAGNPSINRTKMTKMVKIYPNWVPLVQMVVKTTITMASLVPKPTIITFITPSPPPLNAFSTHISAITTWVHNWVG